MWHIRHGPRPTASSLLQGPLFVEGGRASLGPTEEDGGLAVAGRGTDRYVAIAGVAQFGSTRP